MSKIKLGDQVKDTITLYGGVVIGITKWVNGCDRIGVQSPKLQDGLPLEAQWFDVTQLKLVKAKKKKVVKKNTGGPISPPQRKPNAKRF